MSAVYIYIIQIKADPNAVSVQSCFISMSPIFLCAIYVQSYFQNLLYLTLFHYNSGLDRRKKEPSIFLKIPSKHRQVISSKFPKSFMGACGLVVLGEFLKV